MERVRKSDPRTSHEAAAGQADSKITLTQRRVLSAFKLYGEMTDATLVAVLNGMEREAGLLKLTSPSGARSRRSELSKPNEDRLVQLRTEWWLTNEPKVGDCTLEEGEAMADAWARSTLRVEGFRSPLWNTGKVEKLPTGYNAVVWGIAS